MLQGTSVTAETVDMGFVHLGFLKVAFLGVVQGITELLPISSMAHMRIVPSLLGWPDPGSAFSAAMQLASLGAMLLHFRKDISKLVFESLNALASRNFKSTSLRISMGLVLGTLPIGVLGLLLKKTSMHQTLRFEA